MDLADLQLFKTVAEEGGIVRASRDIGQRIEDAGGGLGMHERDQICCRMAAQRLHVGEAARLADGFQRTGLEVETDQHHHRLEREGTHC